MILCKASLVMSFLCPLKLNFTISVRKDHSWSHFFWDLQFVASPTTRHEIKPIKSFFAVSDVSFGTILGPHLGTCPNGIAQIALLGLGGFQTFVSNESSDQKKFYIKKSNKSQKRARRLPCSRCLAVVVLLSGHWFLDSMTALPRTAPWWPAVWPQGSCTDHPRLQSGWSGVQWFALWVFQPLPRPVAIDTQVTRIVSMQGLVYQHEVFPSILWMAPFWCLKGYSTCTPFHLRLRYCVVGDLWKNNVLFRNRWTSTKTPRHRIRCVRK